MPALGTKRTELFSPSPPKQWRMKNAAQILPTSHFGGCAWGTGNPEVILGGVQIHTPLQLSRRTSNGSGQIQADQSARYGF